MSEKSCLICDEAAAVTFCYCGQGETFLCSQCYSVHVGQNPEAFHMNVPIISYGAHKKKGYLERLQVRVAELRKRTEFLHRNLTRADECISTFSTRVADLIERIQAEAKEITHALTANREKMKAAIDQAVKEAEATIHEDETPSISELGA